MPTRRSLRLKRNDFLSQKAMPIKKSQTLKDLEDQAKINLEKIDRAERRGAALAKFYIVGKAI